MSCASSKSGYERSDCVRSVVSQSFFQGSDGCGDMQNSGEMRWNRSASNPAASKPLRSTSAKRTNAWRASSVSADKERMTKTASAAKPRTRAKDRTRSERFRAGARSSKPKYYWTKKQKTAWL